MGGTTLVGYHSIKKQSKTEPGNYRPVSILSVTSKILERIVYNQLEHYLKEKKLLYKLQSGFRPSFPTGRPTCLTFLMDYIYVQKWILDIISAW